MKNEAVVFMDLLEAYFTEYMPYVLGLSDNTVRSYRDTFRLLFNYLYSEKNIQAGKISFKLLNYETITSFLNWLENERGCSVSTRNQRLAALSAFAVYAGSRNFEAASVFMNSVNKIPKKKTPQPLRTIFTVDEVSCLLRMPDISTGTGKRDHALLSLMYASGARAQEICDLRARDVLFQGDITKIIITGKGGKTRRIIISKACAGILKQYMLWKGVTADSHIFSSRTHEHMSISCIEEIYRKYINAAREQYPDMFTEKRYTPHTMRHSCATHMLEAGIPIVAIKNFLGHASVTTTERYAELSQSTVNRHIREWNEKWFHGATQQYDTTGKQQFLPHFLR